MMVKWRWQCDGVQRRKGNLARGLGPLTTIIFCMSCFSNYNITFLLLAYYEFAFVFCRWLYRKHDQIHIKMSIVALTVEIGAVCCLAAFLLHRYGNWKAQHVLVTLATFISWYFSFMIIFTLPIDVSNVSWYDIFNIFN